MTNTDIEILLVEDDEVDKRAIQRAFNKAGIVNAIRVAHDGVEALEVLRGTHPDGPLDMPYIILLDLNMPRMNGIEFLEELRSDKHLAQSIVFVLTTSEEERDITAAYQKHVAGYITKGDAGQDFLNVIHLIKEFKLSVKFPDS